MRVLIITVFFFGSSLCSDNTKNRTLQEGQQEVRWFATPNATEQPESLVGTSESQQAHPHRHNHNSGRRAKYGDPIVPTKHKTPRKQQQQQQQQKGNFHQKEFMQADTIIKLLDLSSGSGTTLADGEFLNTNNLLNLKGGPNPNIEVTIEVLHGPQKDVEEFDTQSGAENQELIFKYGHTSSTTLMPTTIASAEKIGQRLTDTDNDIADVTSGGSGGSGTIEMEWSSWSRCSVACGNGRQKRNRACGMNCREVETRRCRRKKCKKSNRNSGKKRPLAPRDSTTVNTPYDDQKRNPTMGIFIDPEKDSCAEWLKCKNPFLRKYLSKLGDLPSCPCDYPTQLSYDNQIFDRQKNRSYAWAEKSDSSEHLRVYKPTARYCIRSTIVRGSASASLAAQQCCYDEYGRLLTRGPGAGTPMLISPEISQILHHKIDVLPWIICKGDWTRYNSIRPPNNGEECQVNPNFKTYRKQVLAAKHYR